MKSLLLIMAASPVGCHQPDCSRWLARGTSCSPYQSKGLFIPSFRRLLSPALTQEYRILDNLTREKSKARSLVIRLSRGFPVIERLKKIPGVGPVLSARFVAYVQDPHRFNKRSLARFSQLGIVKRSSDGVSLGREHLEKSGNGALKDLSRKAFQGALKTKKPNGIKTFYARSLSRTKNADHARLNTQRKVLGTMNAMWRDGTEYSDEVFLRKGA
jgi:transposase